MSNQLKSFVAARLLLLVGAVATLLLFPFHRFATAAGKPFRAGSGAILRGPLRGDGRDLASQARRRQNGPAPSSSKEKASPFRVSRMAANWRAPTTMATKLALHRHQRWRQPRLHRRHVHGQAPAPETAQLEGVYASKRVKLDFQNKDGGLNGTILFNGKEFQFSATESAGDLEGVFKTGARRSSFLLQCSKDELLFKTGKFEEVISLAERRTLEAAILQKRRALEREKILRANIPILNKDLTSIKDTFWRNLRLLTNGLTIGGSLGSDYESLAFSSGTEESQGEPLLWATQYYILPSWKKKDPSTRSMAGIRLTNIATLSKFFDYGDVMEPAGGKLGGIVIKLESPVSVN